MDPVVESAFYFGGFSSSPTIEVESMAQKVGNRYSNVRYWRYVFTPMLLLTLLFGLFMLYSGDKASGASFQALTGVLRRNIPGMNNNPTKLNGSI